MIRPPITRIVSPVTYDDASEARKTHASAISSGRPRRRSGMSLSCAGSPGGVCRNSGYHSAYRRSVSISPGTTMLARIPNGPSSAASARTKPKSPDFGQRRHDAHARFATLRRHRVELVGVGARVEDESRPFRRERERDGAADVAAGTGDERGLALELHVDHRPVL